MSKLLKIFAVLVLAYLIAIPAYAVSREDLETGVLLAQASPQGRSVISASSVLIKVWYSDGSSTNSNAGTVTISDNTAPLSALPALSCDEVGGPPARFNGTETGHIYLNCTTGNTIQNVVDIINSDSSGYWHAEVGPDAYPDMPAFYLAATSRTACNVGKSKAIELVLDAGEARYISCGVQAVNGSRIRLKKVYESTTGSKGPHWLEVYDGNTIIFRKTFTAAESCIRSSAQLNIMSNSNEIIGDSMTPNTVDLTDANGEGISSSPGKKLTVLSRWNQSGSYLWGGTKWGEAVTTCNTSIFYDVVQTGS